MGLTGIKDVDLMILDKLSDRDLLNFCITNKSNKKLCDNQDFWRNRFIKRFGDVAGKYKNPNRSWKNHYLIVISDLDEYQKNGMSNWEFFNEISWHITSKPSNPKRMLESRTNYNDYEKMVNLYWLLELGNKITINYPIDRYSEMENIEREYVSDKQFTPTKVLDIVYEFYQETLTKKEIEEMIENDVDGFEDADPDIDLQRYQIMGSAIYFEGFTEVDDVKILNLGS